ncbi:MAG: acyl carrier protein [Candidatus Binatia bacterium]
MSDTLRFEIEEKIKHILATELNVSSDILAGSSATTALLGRGVGLDSIETTALVIGLEEEFHISVPDADLTVAVFQTIGSLTEYVIGKIPGASAQPEPPSLENDGKRS